MRRGLYRTGRGLGERNGLLRSTCRDCGTRGLGRAATFRGGEGRRGERGEGEEYLRSLLDADAGARYLGELGIGTNYGIRRPSANVLFDEKLGGTVHLAIGRSYAQTGGKNDSSVHTDLVCDLRQGGELYADGELIQENGRFLEFDLAGVNDAR